MNTAKPIQVITIYSASRTPAARGRVRLISLLSLLIAAVWLVEVAYPKKILDRWNTVDRWAKGKLMLAAFSQSTDMMAAQGDNPWVALGLAPPPKPDQAAAIESQAAMARKYTQHVAVLTGTFYAWKGLACLAGGWLALAGLIGLTGRRPALRLLGQAGWLMLLSTLATVSAIFVAVRWAGMPPLADKMLYANIAGVQGAYAVFLIIATRLMR